MSLIRKILVGYVKSFTHIGFILLLISCCLAISAAIVLPLWKLAEFSSRIYTVTAFAVISVVVVVVTIMRLRTYLSPDGILPEIRKERIWHVLRKTVKFFVVIGTAILFVYFVMHGMRFIGISVVVAIALVYGFFAFGTGKSGK